MQIRRVVTGHDERGRAVFVADEQLDASARQTQLWGADTTIAYPDGGAPPPPLSNFPPRHGWRLMHVHLPAGSDPVAHPPADWPPPSTDVAYYTDEPGMHWTRTVDCEVVLRGEVVLELDDGVETTIAAGEAIIQNGTIHRWRNTTDGTVTFLAFLMGADHAGIGIPTPQSGAPAPADATGDGVAMRRVATGHDAEGRAVFASDVRVATRPAGLTQLWGADATIAYPDDGAVPPPLSPFPAVGGWRYGVVVLPPRFDPRDAAAPPPDEAALGDPAVHTDAEPGMHWTETIDLEVVIRGEVVLELDDGAEKVLRTGDVIVQNGTRHRWLNRTDEPAVFVAFIVGAEHAGIG